MNSLKSNIVLVREIIRGMEIYESKILCIDKVLLLETNLTGGIDNANRYLRAH